MQDAEELPGGARNPHAPVNQWNLPAWLAPITGVAEILGGLMLLIPRLTTLGAAVIVMVMLGATGTQIMAAEWPRIGVTLVFGTMAGNHCQVELAAREGGR